ncbi:hypothetical protein BpJC4_30970 [Weizmannia acidilactici]|uniref:hypothetical protein n=1 Tax=Weizmannia acidilactici TaxID=2607726 RepID=UPI001276B7E7|nr:hypothetical protein BpJC4_30970 [Weizmannia acidilactici]
MEREQPPYEYEYKPVFKKEIAAAKRGATGCSVFLLAIIILTSIPIIFFRGDLQRKPQTGP